MTARVMLACCGFSISGLLMVGCGESHGGDRDPPTLEELPQQYAGAFCDKAIECVGNLLVEQFFGADCAGELTKTIEDEDLPAWQAGVTAGRITYDASKVSACLSAFSTSGCTGLTGGLPSSCDEVLEGSASPGESCSNDAECAGLRYCETDGTCPGTCTERKAAGIACDDDEECAEGLTCQDDACAVPAGMGETCGGSTGKDCAFGLLCIGEDDETPGSCADFDSILTGALGESCEFLEDVPTLCQEGLFCAVTGLSGFTPNFECIGPASAGGACKLSVPDSCPSGQHCGGTNPDMGDFDGTCAPLPTVGMSCVNVDVGAPCAPGLSCEGGTCRQRQRLGGTCMSGSECYSGECGSAGTCISPMCD